MKYKLISLILVSVLLISLNSCGGELSTHEPTVPSIPETPAVTPIPETPAEQEPIPVDFEVFYAAFAGLSDYRSETVIVVSDMVQYQLLCNSLVDMEAYFYKYTKEFFEDHYLLFCCLRRGYSEHSEISGVTITPEGELMITGTVRSPQTHAFATIRFAGIVSIPKDIKITNPEDIYISYNIIDMTDLEFKEFMESLKNKTQEVQNEN